MIPLTVHFKNRWQESLIEVNCIGLGKTGKSFNVQAEVEYPVENGVTSLTALMQSLSKQMTSILAEAEELYERY